MTEKHTIVLEFPTEAIAEEAYGQILDGGSGDTLADALDMNGINVTYTWDSKTRTVTFTERQKK